MYRGSDSVFRISLSGIAIIFIFFLLVVFGWMFSDANQQRKEALERLTQRQQEDSLPLAREALANARQELSDQLRGSGKNLEQIDEIIAKLTDKAAVETEVAALKARVQELNARLEGLTEVREIIAQAGKSPSLNGATEEELLSALELRARLEQQILASGRVTQRELSDNEVSAQATAALNFRAQVEARLERELGLTIAPGQEATWAQWLVDTRMARLPPGLSVTQGNARARDRTPAPADGGQVVSLPTRLGPQHSNDSTPCWVDRAGDPQFLLTIELRPRDVAVTPAWPPAREQEARAIDGIDRLLVKSLAYKTFYDRIKPVGKHSGNQCRYAVRVKENMRSGELSERAYRQIDPLFYVVVLPR